MPRVPLRADNARAPDLHFAGHRNLRFRARRHDDATSQRATFPDDALDPRIDEGGQARRFHEQARAYPFGDFQHTVGEIFFERIDRVICAYLQGEWFFCPAISST